MTKILIIGSAAAGISAAGSARKTDEKCSITVLSKDSRKPYFRPYLTEFIGDSSIEKSPNFYLKSESWYEKNEVDLKLDTEVTEIDKKNKTVTDINGIKYEYDKLILATGATPFVPLKDALSKDFVFAVRSFDDAKRVAEFSSVTKSGVIIGGGLLGLEAVWSLAQKGLEITVIELADRLLPIQLDKEGSKFLTNVITSKGVKIVTSAMTESIEYDRIVKLKDGKEFKTDLVLFCIGVKAETTLAVNAGLETDRGIIVNEKMQTSDPDIFACGDTAQFGRGVPLWMPAVKQGKVAGTNAAGGEAVFKKEDYPATLNAFGLKLMSIGTTSGDDLETYSLADENVYRKLFFKDDKTVGGILINDPLNTMKVMTAVKKGLGRKEAEKIF